MEQQQNQPNPWKQNQIGNTPYLTRPQHVGPVAVVEVHTDQVHAKDAIAYCGNPGLVIDVGKSLLCKQAKVSSETGQYPHIGKI